MMPARPSPPVLGRYECLVPLGRGGMAEVWVARVRGARGFEKLMAVKTMLPALLDDPVAEAMFLDEARLASRIRHPNVTEIFDLGEEARQLFIAMEWVDGDSLAALVRAVGEARMPLSISLAIAMEAAKGLHAAHELKGDANEPMGLVHRDVSPHNILLSRAGLVVLSDFGIAKAVGQSTRTDTGTVKGKPAYMAPEQALGSSLDRRADLFSLGVIVYELTTGHHPFRGQSAVETADRLLRRPLVKPSVAAGEGYPIELEAFVLRALAREPAERFQSAEELRSALSQLAREVVGECTAEHLAAFVQTHLGERLRARDAEIRSALASVPTAPVRPTVAAAEPTATAVVQERPTSNPGFTRPAADAEVGAGATEVSLARAAARENGPTRSWLPWSLLAASVFVISALAWVANAHRQRAQNGTPARAISAELSQPMAASTEAPIASASSGQRGSAGGPFPNTAGSAQPRPPGSAPARVETVRPRATQPKTSPGIDTTPRIPVRNPGF